MDNVDEKLSQLMQRYFSYVRRKLAAGNATQQEVMRSLMQRERILRIIEKEQRISQRMLAQTLSVRPQSMSEALAKLENDGYIIRRKCPTDKRVTLVSLTEKGRERSRMVDTAIAKQSADFFSPLSGEEKQTLLYLLEKLFVNIGD